MVLVTRMTHIERQNGYILLPVVLTITLVALIAYLISYESTTETNTVASELQADRAQYVADAAMQHALWRVQNNTCMGNVTIPVTQLGSDSYEATISGAATGTAYTITPDQDAWIRSDRVSEVNGSNNDQHIKFELGKIEHALTRFDLSSLPKDVQINNAVAWFYVSPQGVHPEGPVTIHRVTADWSETDATWNTMNGNFNSSNLGTIEAQADDSVWVSVNLTGQVQAWVNGQPNYGILMRSVVEGVHGKYSSREDGANSPRLEVVVGSGTASPVAIQATGTLKNGVKRTLNNSATPAYQPLTSTAFQLGIKGKDAGVRSQQPKDNFGAATEVTVSGDENQEHFLIQFPVEQVPKGSRIVSARLGLYLNWLSSSDPAAEFSVHRIAEPWLEGSGDSWNSGDGANWDTSDANTLWNWQSNHDRTTAIDTIVVDPSFTGWHSWDISTLVQQWTNAELPNYGVVIKGNANTSKAWFRTGDWSDPLHHPRLIIEYACECGNPCMGTSGAGNILMPASSSFTPNADELQRIALLESWGYVVDPYWEKNSQNSWTSKMASYDVVYVPATANATEIGGKLTNASIGIISEHGALNDELGLATSSNYPVGSSIDLSENNHYITSVFPAGSIQLKEHATGLGTVGGTVASGADILATINGKASLITLEAGSTSTTGTATARRAFLPFGSSKTSLDHLTNAGQLIMQRSLDWAMGIGKKVSGNLLLVVGDANNPVNKDLERKSQFETWGYTVTLIDDGVSQTDLNDAAAANDVVYVTASIGGGTLAHKLTYSTAHIVNEFYGKLDNFGFSSNTGVATTSNQFTATDASHYISETLAGAGIIVSSSDIVMPIPSGTLAPEIQSPGLIGLAPILATLDTGAVRWDGQLSPARRVHMPFGAADLSQLTQEGLTLMQRSIEWASGAGPKLGLIAHWKFNETTGSTAVDSAGGHDGIMVSGSWTPAGVIDGALHFSGNSYVSVPHDDVLILNNQFTLSAWATSNSTENYHTIINKGTSGNNQDYWFGLWGNYLTLGFYTNGGLQKVEVQMPDWVPTEPTHFAATFDNTTNTVKLYKNGVLLLSETTAYEPPAGNEDLIIGRNPLNENWNGMLDDVRIYDRVLDAGEISELSSAASGGGGSNGGGNDGCDGTYRDEFNAIDLSGSDGTLDWSTNMWEEVGESDGINSGDIVILNDVSNYQLRIRDNNNGGEGVQREADLSGATTAILSFEYRRTALDSSGDYVAVYASSNGTEGPWTELDQIGTSNDSSYQSYSKNISAYISANTAIRLRSSSTLGNFDTVFFDDIQIQCTP